MNNPGSCVLLRKIAHDMLYATRILRSHHNVRRRLARDKGLGAGVRAREADWGCRSLPEACQGWHPGTLSGTGHLPGPSFTSASPSSLTEAAGMLPRTFSPVWRSSSSGVRRRLRARHRRHPGRGSGRHRRPRTRHRRGLGLRDIVGLHPACRAMMGACIGARRGEPAWTFVGRNAAAAGPPERRAGPGARGSRPSWARRTGSPGSGLGRWSGSPSRVRGTNPTLPCTSPS